MQGDIQICTEPTMLLTVLGSCVAVCLWDRVRGFGGMNHFVLPRDPRGEANTRYGDVAIDELEAGLMWLGCKVANLEAKVFGGAAVLAGTGAESVGTSNVRLALEHLHKRRIPVTARRTGGSLGQQIRFNTGSGAVLFRYIPPGANATPAAEQARGRRP
jgi:chemotaxis protein CheD